MSDTTVRVAHASMQFSDTDAQHTADAQKVFKRCRSRGTRWITGTESGPGADNLRIALQKAAWANGYRFFTDPRTDGWIGVDRSFTTGGFVFRYQHLFDGKAGLHTDRGICSVTFTNEALGKITVGTAHYFTKGKRPGDPFFPENVRYIDAVNAWARKYGEGDRLCFYGGDQNMVDRDVDTFRGGPLTSLWDELGKYEDTGHGNIDVIASYDGDGRTRGASVNALTDAEFHLHSDHFLVEGAFKIKPLS